MRRKAYRNLLSWRAQAMQISMLQLLIWSKRGNQIKMKKVFFWVQFWEHP